MKKEFRFSLVMPTLGRRKEVKIFIDSLVSQWYKNCELIVVDQNEDDFVEKLCNEYMEKIDIKYIRSSLKGLSKNRNIAMKYVTGDIVAFPDDDCEYSENLLHDINNLFNNEEVDIITFKSIDKETKEESNNKWQVYNSNVNIHNIFKTAISYTMFIKIKDINDIIFDEKMGVGSYFGSAEESDLLSELLNKEYRVKYFSNLYAYHPIKEEVKDRVFNYALGKGAFVNKELNYRSKYKFIFNSIEIMLVKPIGGIFLNMIKLDFEATKKYCNILTGRWVGFIKYR